MHTNKKHIHTNRYTIYTQNTPTNTRTHPPTHPHTHIPAAVPTDSAPADPAAVPDAALELPAAKRDVHKTIAQQPAEVTHCNVEAR
jgi:hypothetical protein